MKNQLVEGKYSFTDLVNIPQLEKLFNHFSKATGFALGLVSYPDQKLLISAGWSDICTKFHRAFPESEKHCIESNQNLTKSLKKQNTINIDHCKSGMVDGATPIILRGVHIANLFTGQVLFEEPDINFFENQGNKFGYDMETYLEALKRVPIVTVEKFKETLSFVSEMATMIAEQGLSELKNQESAEDLKRSNIRYQETVNLLPQMVYEADLEGNLTFINEHVYNTLGYTYDDFNKGINTTMSLIPEDREKTQSLRLDK